MHNQEIFTELSLILVVVAVIAGLMRLLRQPLILGYILTGIIVGPILNIIHSKEAFEGFSQIGIALLLFIIGLGMNITTIRNLGKVSIITAASVLVAVGGIGGVAMLLMGFNFITALIMGIALFFSSTIIILKVLADKKELNRLHSQIAIGVIIIDDIVATFAIVLVAALGNGKGLQVNDLLFLGGKAIALAALLFIVGVHVIPRLSKKFAESQELLFLFAVAWGFGISSLFEVAGFSHEVGALFAGISLAGLPYATEMASRLKPLRDFFVVLFFVGLGESFAFDKISEVIVPAVVLSVIVMVTKPIAVLGALGIQRYTKLTSFKAAIHLSQVSEFSIILVMFAASVGVIDPQSGAIITLVALITIALSSYLMHYDNQLYRKFKKKLTIFERHELRERGRREQPYSSILFGYRHGGHELLQMFREMKQRYLVVDYNPTTIEHLEIQGVRHAYGDATDTEFLEEINAGRAKFVASTISDKLVNHMILTHLHRLNPDIVFVCHAHTYEDALELYEKGAAYVILPRFLGNEYITTHIKRYGMDKSSFDNFRARHIISIGKEAVKNT